MKLERRATLCGKSWLSVLLLLSVFAGSERRGSAQDRALGHEAPWLEIDARGDDCVSEPELLQQVARTLDQEPHDGVRIEASTRGRGWVVQMWHAAGQYAVREFPELPVACDLRLRALALSIALAVEHAVAATPVAARSSSARDLGWAVGVHAGASVGELPNAAAFVGLEGRIERGHWVPLELRALADVYAPERSLAGARLATRQLTGALGSCLGPITAETWRLDLCLGVELGAALGRASGVARPESSTAASGAINFGVVSRWSRWRRWALSARLEGFGRFWTPRFLLLEADGDLFAERRLPPAGARLSIGLSGLSK